MERALDPLLALIAESGGLHTVQILIVQLNVQRPTMKAKE